MLDGGQDRGRVMRGAVDHEVALEVRRDDERWETRAGTPDVARTGRTHAGRWNVVPLTTELVVGHDDHGVLGALAAIDRGQERHEVVAAVRFAGIARMLVLLTDRLHEADRLEVAGLRGIADQVLELRLVTQMRGAVRQAGGGRRRE